MNKNTKFLAIVVSLGLLVSACARSATDANVPSATVLPDSQAETSSPESVSKDELPVKKTDCKPPAPSSVEELADQADSVTVARLVDVQPGFSYINSNLDAETDSELAATWDEQILLEFEVAETIKGELEDVIQVPIFGYEASSDKPGAARTAIFEACGLRINESNIDEMFGIALNEKHEDGAYRFQEILHLTKNGEVEKGETSIFPALFEDKEGQKFSELMK